MAYERTIDDETRVEAGGNQADRQIDRSTCIHYRSKAMCVTGAIQPSHADEEHNHDQNCWCNLTQHVLGPDSRLATLQECTSGRDCFRSV